MIQQDKEIIIKQANKEGEDKILDENSNIYSKIYIYYIYSNIKYIRKSKRCNTGYK